MTLAQTVIMIAIGSLLIQQVSGRNLGVTFLIGGVLVGTLIIMEILQLKSDWLEKIITGKSKVVIENGTINERNLAKVRMTVDQLEMNIRQKNVTKLSDVSYVTIEPNGQIGYMLKEEAQPVTKREFQQLIKLISSNQQLIQQINQQNSQNNEENIFKEVSKHGHKKEPPQHLQ
ncbi:DUF421 domain-containing protein [Piscibacillus sp. B03]|uniref:DUF421 domain-containing protein n=1 Tax=Piscibacillus sp. B03 TaxID=3457430 RepID=UPI003FCEA9D5